MKFPLSYYEGYRDEVSRMSFVEGRDGHDGALDFAERTLKQYQAALKARKGVAGGRGGRPRFRGSIRYLKYFLAD